MSTQTMKQSLRQSIIAARQKMAAVERAEYSREITLRILNLPSYKESGTVLGYMSFGAEFASGAWVQQALQDGKQVLLPRVNNSTRQLELFQVVDLQHDVVPGKWGIPEPLPERCRKVDDSERIDFILLPGVAFARDGSRLGYGGGFYDKLLERICPDVPDRLPAPRFALPNPPPESARLLDVNSGEGIKAGGEWIKTGHPVLVAAAFSMQMVKEIPQEATDRKVEWLLIENEVIDCSAERLRQSE